MAISSSTAIKHIKTLRDRKRLSTSDIQKELGLRAQETVRRWLRGESNPSPTMCTKIEELSQAQGIIKSPTASNPFE